MALPVALALAGSADTTSLLYYPGPRRRAVPGLAWPGPELVLIDARKTSMDARQTAVVYTKKLLTLLPGLGLVFTSSSMWGELQGNLGT